MRVLFEYGVDFVNLPSSPPVIENCKKCAFYQYPKIPGGGCVKTDIRLCADGRNGYFAKNYARESVDIMSYLGWENGKDV
jgi:hypothetical protein